MANWFDNVPAPVDANGREVPLDTRELVYRGKTREVWSIAYNTSIGLWGCCFAGTSEQKHLSDCTLPDSWEQLEKDAAKGLCEYFGMGNAITCKGCPAYEDKLSCGCNIPMARDIIRRAKELAGVTE